jgi:hypothetical protein
MKKIVAVSILSLMLLVLGGCYWPGYWHDRHHHGGYDRYENHRPAYNEVYPYHERGGYRRR